MTTTYLTELSRGELFCRLVEAHYDRNDAAAERLYEELARREDIARHRRTAARLRKLLRERGAAPPTTTSAPPSDTSAPASPASPRCCEPGCRAPGRGRMHNGDVLCAGHLRAMGLAVPGEGER